ncbi:MAG TPA: DUF2735 domain-containing protein [Methyloceanibacter sp.]|jgi:hypothetical protein|nr:DUF2735 domain-containing protein [Methyloceanibacter sp.]
MQAGLGVCREEHEPAENFAAPRPVKVASGSAWYHEEAVQNAERVRTS